MTRSEHDPAKRGGLPAGYDEQDPYEGEDLDEYPAWWRENIEEFRKYNLRPYRPPRFADSVIVPPVIADLESETDTPIRLRTLDPATEGGRWEVLLGRERVTTVEHYRHSDGYSVYDIEAEMLKELIREAADT